MKTMTIRELSTALQALDPDTPILATWESVYAGIDQKHFELREVKGRQTLVIDVEDHWGWDEES